MSPVANTGIPLYFQVRQDLAQQIGNGQLAPGNQLPTEDELIAKYAVSRTTIRKAIQDLEQLGLVEIRRGKGTFVRSGKITQEFDGLTGFVEDMVAAGKHPSARVLKKGPIVANEEIARQLRLDVGAPVMQIVRVRLADLAPVSLDETYLPIDLGQKVAENDLETYPIFSLLEGKYDTPLLEADYRLEAIAADPFVADSLDMEVNAPVMLIERVSYSLDNRPVDFEKLYYRGDRIRLSTRLRRRPSSLPLDALARLALKNQ